MSEELLDTPNTNSEDERRDGSSPAPHRGNNQERPRFIRKERAGSSDYGFHARPRFTPNRTDGTGSDYHRSSYSNRYGNDGDRYNRYNNRYDGGEGNADRPARPYRPRFNAEGADGYRSNYQRPQRNYGDRPFYGASEGYSSENRYNHRPSTYGTPRYGAPNRQGYAPRYRDYNDAENQGGEYRPQREPRPYANRNNGGEGYGYRQRDGFNGSKYPNRRPFQRPYSSSYNPDAKYSHKKRLEYQEKNIDPTVPIRLNKFLANAGVCSRRDADKFISTGVVTVNGNVVTELGTKVLRTDTVMFHDQPVTLEKKVYVLLNKPKGYVTTSEDPQNRKTVMELVRNACPERIYPVGRLDRSTTGVLLFTNDGELASKLTHPKYLKKKIYHVFLDRNVTAADLQQIADGITLEDGVAKADAVEYASETDKKQVGIEIHSGKNRIVRRIFEHLNYHVVKLDRVYFAGLTKKNVRRGDWRYLTEKEVDLLKMGAFE